jgi:hypothetical protein
MSPETGLETWAVVELFGHQRIAGLVREQEIAGHGFLRVDVPGDDGAIAFSRMYGTAAIYSITPVSEARRAASAIRTEPLSVYMAPALTPGEDTTAHPPDCACDVCEACEPEDAEEWEDPEWEDPQ